MLQKGLSVCLIDKAVFPRPKTCAGLVTEKTYRLVRALFGEQDPDGLFCDTVSEITLFGKTAPLAHTGIGIPFRMADRTVFDNGLVERCRQLGGILLEGQLDYAIDYDRHVITLADGGVVWYDYLVFADGALSRAHRDFGLSRTPLAFCVETFVPSGAMETAGVEIHFGRMPLGYLWVFPHGDRVCVGLVNRFSKAFPYRKLLEDFLKEWGVDPAPPEGPGCFPALRKTASPE